VRSSGGAIEVSVSRVHVTFPRSSGATVSTSTSWRASSSGTGASARTSEPAAV